jgi:hypothetical protein
MPVVYLVEANRFGLYAGRKTSRTPACLRSSFTDSMLWMEQLSIIATAVGGFLQREAY